MDSGQDGNNVVGSGGVGVGSGAPISSGQGMMPNQPIVSGGGDIVLNNSGDQKSKKGLKWVIGIVVGVLILAGIGVGVWWGMKSNDGGILSVYNSYADFVIFGPDSSNDDMNGEILSIPKEEYAIVEYSYQISSESEEYLKNLDDRFDLLMDAVEVEGLDFNNIAVLHKGFLDFYIFSSRVLYSDMILTEFLEDFGEDLIGEIDKRRANIEDYNPVLFSDLSILKLYVNSQLERYYAIKSFGCMDSDGVNLECIENLTEDELVNIPVADGYSLALKRQNDFAYSMFIQTLDAMRTVIMEVMDE